MLIAPGPRHLARGDETGGRGILADPPIDLSIVSDAYLPAQRLFWRATPGGRGGAWWI